MASMAPIRLTGSELELGIRTPITLESGLRSLRLGNSFAPRTNPVSVSKDEMRIWLPACLPLCQKAIIPSFAYNWNIRYANIFNSLQFLFLIIYYFVLQCLKEFRDWVFFSHVILEFPAVLEQIYWFLTSFWIVSITYQTSPVKCQIIIE